MPHRDDPPTGLRFLNSREYAGAQTRHWSEGWHAPRLNRWERLRVAGGTAELARLEPAHIAVDPIKPADDYWVAPGERWRLFRLDPGATLSVAPHAQDEASSSRPQPARENWLGGLTETDAADAVSLRDRLESLQPGERRLCRGDFEWREAVAGAGITGAHRLSWHPLGADGDGRFCAVAIHCMQPVTLVDYLGRDHAIIEAALSRATGSVNDHARFRGILLRHVAIEERLLFPPYEATPAGQRMVRGLLREHRYIRECLAEDADAGTLRRLWRLLEAHDEKEEQLAYPGIAAAAEDGGAGLLESALTFPASRG